MEEQACLVRARSDSENSSKLGSFGSISRTMTYTDTRLGVSGTEGAGEPASTNMTHMPPENTEGNESGELLDYNDSSVLEQFHEDAIRQAGCGLSQARVYLAVCLAIAGASLELASIAFVLPSAEIELCILPHEKNWLVLISIVGWSLGGVGWGALAERGGRRRALHAALAVNAVFAAIAAFMPTYGTFMMARFCSALGSGGIIPTGFTYCGELCPRQCRTLLLALLPASMGGGILLSAGLAKLVLPYNGHDALIENKEHFSAWHRYLLVCTIPILASLVSLIWTPESPRYLLDVGRDVDAMMVYQNIQSGNRKRASDADYRLSELALPSKRRPPALHHVRHGLKMFWQAFFQLFSSTYRNTTISLTGMLLFTVGIQFYLSAYVPSTVTKLENEAYELSKQSYENVSYEGVHYNETLENVSYEDVSFTNCTFRDMIMSHVSFVNCTFVNTALSNIKTSFVIFDNALFVNSTIIDTDMETGRELVSCTFNTTTVRGMTGSCPRHAELRWTQLPRLRERTLGAHAVLAAAPPLAARAAHGYPAHAITCSVLLLLSPALFVSPHETTLYIIEALYGLLSTIIFFSVGVKILETYPSNLRCTAHGLILSVSYIAGAGMRGAPDLGPAFSSLLCAVFAVCATVFAIRLK
ncbi:synaptic vesicle glycoprotein 2A-like [Danaus plexippus]|uniref:synaptic vesicle glycoprotein 2A-like n=1 Tax=Danaus plexippus TaxID=13037 RepID=UPI002AB10973|nr:synaptic vesicle glycoprotein 2A-like [Danaus plexippus]XP_032525196.2 synaptic vesicle glycoprotein 2A-like [Danaus plexippus]XP_032525197.2 synaptic vesicle glycoprotein 2A-like [Danaus plexippus]